MKSDNGAVFFVGGGTGGHFFPAVASAQALADSDMPYSSYLLTDYRCKKYIHNISLPITVLDIASPRRSFFGLARFILSNIKVIFRCWYLLKKHNTKLVIGFGGYPSFAPLVAAFFARIPIALHEQNSFLGAVNRLFLKRAIFVALSFKKTANIENSYLAKTILTGNPIRTHVISNVERVIRKRDEGFVLMITGGSQAAKIFSEIIPKVIASLAPELQKKLSIYHQAPRSELQQLRDEYSTLGIKSVVEDFFHDIGTIYGKADLCICRAGASTVAELQANRLPAILVPYPYAAHDHQSYNAQSIAAMGAGWCIKQSDMSVKELARRITELIEDPALLQLARDAYPNQEISPSDAMLHLIRRQLA